MKIRQPSPEFLRSLLLAASLGAAALSLAMPAAGAETVRHPPARSVTQSGPLADFKDTQAPWDVREVANWSFYTRDNHGRAVVILDKRQATVYAFDPQGHLVASAPALLGLAVGDHTVPGVGDKPLSQVPEEDRTTPAGRFEARLGHDDTGVDVVWIDYDAAVAMHRVITTYPEQRRPERLASPDPKVRRISWGCINLPVPFYEKVLSPTVRQTGAIVYVLPEMQAPSAVFGSWDVTDPAARPPAARRTHEAHAVLTTAPASGR